MEGWEVEFALVHRRMLLVASVEFCDEEDLASSGSTALWPGDLADTFEETLVGDSGAAEATRPEFAGQLVQGLGRLQPAWAIRRWWSSVVNAREARETRGQGEARVRGASLAKMVKMAARWQSSWVLQEWQQAVVVGKRGRSLVAVVAGRRDRSAWRGGVQVIAEILGLVFVRSRPRSPEQAVCDMVMETMVECKIALCEGAHEDAPVDGPWWLVAFGPWPMAMAMWGHAGA